MRFVIVTAITIACFSIIGVAQNRSAPTSDEILQWFPEATYKSIRYSNYAEMEAQPAFRWSRNTGDQKADRIEGLLPVSELEWSAGGLIMIEPSAEPESDNNEKTPTRHEVLSGKAESTRKSTAESYIAAKISVWRYHDPESALNTILQEENVEPDLHHREMPIYSYVQRDGTQSTIWISLAPQGDLLISNSLPTLKDMIDAGQGFGYGLLDQAAANDLREELVTAEWPPAWFFSPTRSLFEVQADASNNAGMKERFNRAARNHLQYTFSYWKYDEGEESLIERRIFQLGDEEQAAAFFRGQNTATSIVSPDTPQEMITLGEAHAARTERTLDGARIIWTTIQDEEYLDLHEKARKALLKYREEMAEQQKSDQAEK